jgi:hypothetical protein
LNHHQHHRTYNKKPTKPIVVVVGWIKDIGSKKERRRSIKQERDIEWAAGVEEDPRQAATNNNKKCKQARERERDRERARMSENERGEKKQQKKMSKEVRATACLEYGRVGYGMVNKASKQLGLLLWHWGLGSIDQPKERKGEGMRKEKRIMGNGNGCWH